MALLAVERNEEARMQQRVDDLELLLAGMAGDMQALELIVDNVGSLAESSLMILLMDFSLPGMAEAEMITRSPA